MANRRVEILGYTNVGRSLSCSWPINGRQSTFVAEKLNDVAKIVNQCNSVGISVLQTAHRVADCERTNTVALIHHLENNIRSYS